MLKKLLPVLLALIGLGGGVGAGLALRPAPEPAPEAGATELAAEGEAAATGEHGEKAKEIPPPTQEIPETEDGATPLFDYVKLNNQFVVPVVIEGQVASMVILALSLEVKVGGTEQVYVMEPKLRDVFLQVLFDHANSGGFAGDFTQNTNMVVLRDALREAAKKTLGEMVSDVLIIDIARQDI